MAKYKSGLRFRFEVWMTGETEPMVIVTDIRDVLQWERNNKRSFVGSDPSIDQLLWLAWAHAKRSGKTDLQFQQWTDQVEDFDSDQADVPGTEDEPDPTNAEAGAGV